MFAQIFKKNPQDEQARMLYSRCLNAVQHPEFYRDMGVPDTLDGRFDLLLLHLFIIIHVVLKRETSEGADLNQALFDITFADMDQTLREMGIGDMGVPKHMRRMMKAFNGRMHSYTGALARGELAMKEAILRNVYNVANDSNSGADKLHRYTMDKIAGLSEKSDIELTFVGEKEQ